MKYDFDTYVERRGTACVKWDTYGPDILPMWIADNDFLSPPEAVEAVADVVRQGLFGYPLADGTLERACARWQKKRFGWSVKEADIAWCPSLGSAIALCVNAFSGPGEGVAMLRPIYPPFMCLCSANDREPRGSALKWRNGRYEIDFEDLEKILQKEDTRLFLLCNPHNPTGRVFDREELERIGELCLKHGVTIFSDEIHEDIVYSGRHLPLPTISPQLSNISLVGVNASKTFNLAGLRSAAVISENPALLAAFVKQRDRFKLGPCALGIAGVAAAWEKGADYADRLVAYLKANLEHAVERITTECPGLSASMPQATYLLWLDCRGMGLNNEELESFFLQKAKVALNNGPDFGPEGEGFMRLNAACPRSLLDEGLNRIVGALRRMR